MAFENKRGVIGQCLLLLLLFMGFAIRIYTLNAVAINPDEQRVLHQILDKPFVNVLSITTLHYFPEHTFANILIWLSHKLGWQPFLLRWPAVLFGVLTLALLYRFTKKILDPFHALAATFLLAFSTYHLGNSIKIRGYSEMAFFAVASFYFLWGAMETSRWRAWLFYTLTMTLAIYSHFYAFTLLATQGIIVAIWLVIRAIQQRPKMSVFLSRQVVPPLVSGVGSAIMAILLLSPVLLPHFFQDFVAADTSYPVSTNSLLDFLLPYFDLFNLYSGTVSVWGALLFLILTLVGIFYLFQRKPGLVFILLGWLLIPLLMVVVAQVFIDWFYVVHRYFIYILPVFIIIVVTGWVGLTKTFKNVNPVIGAVFAAVILIALLINSLLSISNYLQIVTEGNWQYAADYLVENAQPTDMFICEPVNHGWKAADLDPTDNCTRDIHYRVSRQMNIIYPIYNLFAVATSQTFIENPVLLERNPRIWVVVWGLPESLDNQVESQASFDRFGHTIVLGPIAGDNVIDSFGQALEQISTLTDDPLTQFALLVRLADLQVAVGQTKSAVQTLARVKKMMPADDEARHQVAAVEQRLNQPPIIDTPEHNLSVNLGEQIVLQGYSVTPAPPLPGQPIELTLFWQALASMEVDYSAFLHLRNEANQTVAQFDFFPGRPTSSWWAGDLVQSKRQFEVPTELPVGKYRLLLGLYDPSTLGRLSVLNDATGENAIELIELEIK